MDGGGPKIFQYGLGVHNTTCIMKGLYEGIQLADIPATLRIQWVLRVLRV